MSEVSYLHLPGRPCELCDGTVHPIMSRAWAMPSPHTFEIAPIATLLDRVLAGARVIVDPFCGRSMRGTLRNDLNPDLGAGRDAIEWLMDLSEQGVVADAVLLDPPYSPRQIAEVYKSVGRTVGMKETQNARLYKDAKEGLDRLLRRGGVAVTCGWNSAGFGKERGYVLEEILLVCSGSAHNDTIVTVERKP